MVKPGSTDARLGVEASTAVLTRLGGGLEQESSSAITRLAVLAELRGAAGIEEEEGVIAEGVGVEELDGDAVRSVFGHKRGHRLAEPAVADSVFGVGGAIPRA